MKKNGIVPHYGIVEKDNILFWIYDCYGAPDPHISFETKSIFLFIDSIAKKFKSGELTEADKQQALIINDCWFDYYTLKKNANSYISKARFVLLDDEKFHTEWNILESRKFYITKRNTNYNYYRIELSCCNSYYSLMISHIEGRYDYYTVGCYDFENKIFLFRNNYRVNEPVCINFMLKDNRNIAICIYAGLCGETSGKEINGCIMLSCHEQK